MSQTRLSDSQTCFLEVCREETVFFLMTQEKNVSCLFFLEGKSGSPDERRKRKKELKLTRLGIILAIAKGRDIINEMRKMLN